MSLTYVEDSYDLLRERAAYIPPNFQRSIAGSIGTAESIDPYEIIKSKLRSYFNSALLKVESDTKEYITAKPISVKVYSDEKLYFAENENLAVCGTESDHEGAIYDLGLHIIHFFEYYKKIDEGKLAGEGLRLKKLYKNLFVEK